ncbi:MAG: LysR family transcriptional regulator [Pseudomonadales bacterium]|nr:LysR family transcriptional regulator [Pseudomonadales bacterium]
MPRQLYDVDLKLLRIFREVTRQKSFSLAADSLGTSLSNVSMNIAQLESRVGMRLCERGVKGFRLTPQGEGLLDASEELDLSMDRFRDKIDALSEQMHKEFRIGVLSELFVEGTVRLHELIQHVEASLPKSTFSLEFGPVEDLKEKVSSGELHCAFGYFNELEDKIKREFITKQKHRCYCGKGHALFDTPDSQIELDDLQNHKIAGYDDLFESEKATVPLFAKYDSCSRSGGGILALVLGGSHLGLLVESFAARWVEQGLIRPLGLEELVLDVDIELIYPINDPTSVITDTVLAAVRTLYPEADSE